MAGLYPNTPFSEGSVFTPELADLAFEAPIFDGQNQYKGHREKIRDDELSDLAGATKDRLRIVTDGLKPSVSSGLTVAYQSGTVVLPSGELLAIVSGLIVVPDNATSLIWVDSLGVIASGTIAPAIRILIAKVTTVSGTITALQDLRFNGLHPVSPISASIKVFGGSNTQDKVCTNGEVLDQGYYYFRDFTVPAGVSITIDKQARLFCSGNVSIQGVINITTAANGARPFSTGTISTINIGGVTGTGLGAGSGSSGAGVTPYPYTAQPVGSGGGLGFAGGDSGAVAFGGAGSGGGSLWVEASGEITVSGSIVAKGTDASIGFITSGTNVLVSGSGGGSGGLVYLSSLVGVTCTNTSVIDVRGGNGASAVRVGTGSANGGGGGGGGWLVLASPFNNTTGATFLLSGGTPGATVGEGTGALGGGTGGAYGGAGGGAGSTPQSGGTGRLVLLSFVPIGS
ncbi:MAG: hypothetical protein KME59_21560 [Trichormus sp. ATA11-4-KO1]|jgi:hypothetical protein|nr:hypothetical protein [Trichormus sp. ATA11-4-KO1]